MNDKINKLRQKLKEHKLDAYIIPSGLQGRLRELTNFSGSAGTAVITRSAMYFFTDGRYTQQAKEELDKDFQTFNIKDMPIKTWLSSFLNKGNKLGFNPALHSISQINHLDNKKALVPIDLLPKVQSSIGTVSHHKLKYTGQSAESKIKALIDYLKANNLDGTIITDATSICWLLNIRAYDVAFTPSVNGYLIVTTSSLFAAYGNPSLTRAKNKMDCRMQRTMTKLELFSDFQTTCTIKNVTILPLASFEKALGKIKNKKLLIPDQAPFFLTQRLKNYVLGDDPCLLPKACKNKIELKGAMQAGVKDTKALTNFFNWLYKALKHSKLTELGLVDQLIEFRKEQKNFISPSFPSIVGFNSNGAIIHYQPKPASNKKIIGNGLLLIDSGSQYLEGTTDITRTIAIGKPTKAQIHNFTLVLKGHINLITSIFPNGTSGAQLDSLAHMALWKEGKDYDHGTGHGVGSVLNVHEGPQSISKAGLAPLREGMIVSIEPGFYLPKAYGIRIENLAYVKKAKFPGYLTFEVLTYVPIDLKLVDFDLLTKEETSWLKNYNKKCNEIFNHS